MWIIISQVTLRLTIYVRLGSVDKLQSQKEIQKLIKYELDENFIAIISSQF